MQQPIKFDTQKRTSWKGFQYSTSDPANRHDREPTDFSYIDFVFSGQLAVVEEQLKSAPVEQRDELQGRREEILHSMAQRKMRTERYRLTLPVAVKADAPPLGGELIAYLGLLIAVTGVCLVVAPVDGEASGQFLIIGLGALFAHYAYKNYNVDPFEGYEVIDD